MIAVGSSPRLPHILVTLIHLFDEPATLIKKFLGVGALWLQAIKPAFIGNPLTYRLRRPYKYRP